LRQSESERQALGLHDAFTHGSEREAKGLAAFLLANKADVNAKASDGATALHAAADHGEKDLVELLLNAHADVNAKDNSGVTPLHLAAAHGRLDIAELLVAHKADLNLKNNFGLTPLQTAEQQNYRALQEMRFLPLPMRTDPVRPILVRNF